MANSPAIAKDSAAFYWWLVLLCHPGWDEETETDCEIFVQAMRPNSSSGRTDWATTKPVCTCGRAQVDVYGKQRRRHIYHWHHLCRDLNFSHLRICMLTIVTAPLAEIIRGHEKLDGCCINNKIRQLLLCRRMHCASSLHSVARCTHCGGDQRVFRVILCADR